MTFTAATYNATATFESCTKAGKGFGTFNQWVKKALYGTLTEKEGENGEYSIYKLFYKDSADHFTFNIESSSVENLYWQLENIKKFLSTLSGAFEFSAEVLVKSEKVYWHAKK